MNKNKLLAITFSIIFQFSISQIKNGIIEYGAIFNLDMTSSGSQYMIDVQKEIKEEEKNVIFTLSFLKNESNFSMNSFIFKNPLCKMYLSGAKQCVISYSNLVTQKYRDYYNDTRFGEYVIEYEQQAEWILSEETKMINGYLCYKATTKMNNEDGAWSENPSFIRTAWYTPKIPVKLGPSGYHGLPGLILEISSNINTFYVKKITLNSDKPIEIDPLDKYKLKTHSEIIDYINKNKTQAQKNSLERANQNEKK